MKAIYGKDDVVHGEKLLCVEGDVDEFADRCPIVNLRKGAIYTADKPSPEAPNSYIRIVEEEIPGINGWRYNRFIPLRYLLEE